MMINSADGLGLQLWKGFLFCDWLIRLTCLNYIENKRSLTEDKRSLYRSFLPLNYLFSRLYVSFTQVAVRGY